MAPRLTVAFSLLTLVLLAGCSDGPAKGDLVAVADAIAIDGTTDNKYTAASYPNGNNPVTGQPICADAPNVPPCVEPKSEYKFHFMSLPEPSGDGYTVFYNGGAIGERSAIRLNLNASSNMWEASHSVGEDQSQQFDEFQLRMGDYVLASAKSAAGSQKFVASADLSGVTVAGTFKGRELTLDVKGLPEGDGFVGRLYLRNDAGNLTAGESFPVVNGVQSYTAKDAPVGDYAEFKILVGQSQIYLYHATVGKP